MTPTGRKRIGEILCEKGYLSQSQLKEALEKQKGCCKNYLLGRILMDSGYITAEQLLDAFLIQEKCEEPVPD